MPTKTMRRVVVRTFIHEEKKKRNDVDACNTSPNSAVARVWCHAVTRRFSGPRSNHSSKVRKPGDNVYNAMILFSLNAQSAQGLGVMMLF